MNDEYGKYKFDDKGLASFIVGVIIVCLVSVFGFGRRFVELEQIRNIVLASIIVVSSSMFGAISGALTAFIGVICSMVFCGFNVTFTDPIALTILGIFVGQFADKYGIRENRFTKDKILIWNLIHIMAVIVAFVFVKPYIDYICYDRDLFDGIITGVNVSILCILVSGACLSVLLFLISKLIAYVKS